MRLSDWDSLDGDVTGLILQQITSRADILALTLVSKASRTITEPFLYKKIEWTWLADQPPPIIAFLRTILHRPQLANHVRSVALLGDNLCDAPYIGDRLPTIPVVGSNLDSALEAITKTRVPYSFAHRWEKELNNGTMDAFVSLLLSQLHHLTHLFLARNFTKQSTLLGMLLCSALCEKGEQYMLPRFKYLREVDYELSDCNTRKLCGRNTADILPLFYLPEVQRLSVALDNPITLTWPLQSPLILSTLTSLDLALIRETHLAHLLSLTPRLTTLRWQFFYCELSEHASNTSHINLDEVGNALSYVRNTLREFCISAYCSLGFYIEQPPLTIQESLTTLGDFNKLEKLEIPLQFLVASFVPATSIHFKDVVPPRVQSLTITDDFEKHWEQNEWDDVSLYNAIALWLQDSSILKPDLRTISLLLNNTDEHWGADMRQLLEQLCIQCGFQAKINKMKKDFRPAPHVSQFISTTLKSFLVNC